MPSTNTNINTSTSTNVTPVTSELADTPGSSSTGHGTGHRYVEPDWVTRRIFNPLMIFLVKIGLPVRGARELHVRGRSSGEWRTVPVNPLTIDGRRYLVAPRGETQWVRNLRAAGTARLRRGRRFDDIVALEVADADKPPVLRAYLDAWGFEVGKFFEGLDADATDEQLVAIAPGFPVFEVS